MKKFLKENWFIIAFVAAPLMTGLIFLFSLNGRIHDSPQQKALQDTHMDNVPTAKEEYQAFIQDSLKDDVEIRNTESAIKKRAITLERDSIERVRNRKNDSVMLDYVQRNAEQIYQMKELIEN